MFVGAPEREEFLARDTHSNIPRNYSENLARLVGTVCVFRIHAVSIPFLVDFHALCFGGPSNPSNLGLKWMSGFSVIRLLPLSAPLPR